MLDRAAHHRTAGGIANLLPHMRPMHTDAAPHDVKPGLPARQHQHAGRSTGRRGQSGLARHHRADRLADDNRHFQLAHHHAKHRRTTEEAARGFQNQHAGKFFGLGDALDKIRKEVMLVFLNGAGGHDDLRAGLAAAGQISCNQPIGHRSSRSSAESNRKQPTRRACQQVPRTRHPYSHAMPSPGQTHGSTLKAA